MHVRLALPRRRHSNLSLQAAVQWVYKHENRSSLTFLKSICKTMQTSCTATEAARDAAAGDAARMRGELAAMTLARDAAVSDLAAAREQLASFRESSGKTAEVLAAEQASTAALTQRNQAQVCGFAHINVKCIENHLAPCPLLLDECSPLYCPGAAAGMTRGAVLKLAGAAACWEEYLTELFYSSEFCIHPTGGSQRAAAGGGGRAQGGQGGGRQRDTRRWAAGASNLMAQPDGTIEGRQA